MNLDEIVTIAAWVLPVVIVLATIDMVVEGLNDLGKVLAAVLVALWARRRVLAWQARRAARRAAAWTG